MHRKQHRAIPQTSYRIESSDYSVYAFTDIRVSAVETGLLDEASVELDKQ